tara:strand:+ start:137 stop:316 length:180 start_codon:yes stop_codon:yes gene_type:complete
MTIGNFVPKVLGYLMLDHQGKEQVLRREEVVRQQKELKVKELKVQKRLKEYDKELVMEE